MMATRLKPQTVEDALNDLDKTIPHETLASAMAAAFAEIEAATKAATNPHFKSKYADLGAVIDAVKPALIRHGLFFTQRCHPCDNGVSVETVLHHEQGDKESLGTLFVPADRQNAQGFGSALTYARRYGLMVAFGVPAEDDDGNAAAAAPAPTPDYSLAPELKQKIEALAPKAGKSIGELCSAYSVGDLADLSTAQANKCIARLEELAKVVA